MKSMMNHVVITGILFLLIACGGENGASDADGGDDAVETQDPVSDPAADEGLDPPADPDADGDPAGDDPADVELDAEPDGEDPWGGRTIDEPCTTDRIELLDTATQSGWTAELYVNRAYTCGMSGYHTFTVVYPEGDTLDEPRPLWVRMHGGGTGAFDPDGNYVPPGLGQLDQEGIELALLLTETGLMTKVRSHPAGFRFMMPSMCDHDLYSGVGVPEPNNPYSPDENGATRAADGLLAARAAVGYTRTRVPVSHIFLQGTSAGSIGAFSLAYSLERGGLRLSGIVMDSHVLSEAFIDLIEAGCGPYDMELTRMKIGPMTDPENLPDAVVTAAGITVPLMHVWDRGDPGCCGETPYTWIDDEGREHTMGSCDYHHEALRAAIAAEPPGGSSENLRLCVNDPATAEPGACNMHSPTKIAYDEPTPPGDQDSGGSDYNQHILEWVTARLAETPP